MKLTINDLEKCFNEAIKKDLKYVAIVIGNLKTEKTEETMILNCDFYKFIEFYKREYDYNLKNKYFDKIQIKSFANGNTFEELERKLDNNKNEISIKVDLNIDTDNIEKIINDITKRVNESLLENIKISIK